MAEELQQRARRCFMSFKLLQFSPQTSTRAVRMREVPERWTDGYEHSQGVKFLPAWLDDDFAPASKAAKRRIHWGAISGMALSLVISGGFWAGVGLLIARVVK
jgi:hypothetical protein